MLYCNHLISFGVTMRKRLKSKYVYILGGVIVALIFAAFLYASYLLLEHALRQDEPDIPPEPTKTFNVIFRNEDETEISVRTYNEGDPIEIPPSPTKEEDDQYVYTFYSWDKDVSYFVTEDVVYTAVFEASVKYYDVTFYGYNETVLYSKRVPYGSSVTYEGNTPLRPSDEQYTYTFTTWDTSTEFITKDTVTHAQFEATQKRFTIRFLNYDGSLFQQVFAVYGDDLTSSIPTPSKPDYGNITYLFVAWDQDISYITSDMTVHPEFEAQTSCVITFLDADGTVILSTQYEIDSPIVAPEMPAKKEDLYFSGWDKEITIATGNTVYTALYSSTPWHCELYISYQYEDGAIASPTYHATLDYGSFYEIASPQIPQFEADPSIVSGTINDNLTIVVTYRPSGSIPLKDGIYEISTQAQLIFLSKSSELWSKEFILKDNISLAGIDWTGIGTSSIPFSGTFNGNGYTISNVTITSVDDAYMQTSVGFFNVVSGKISDLNVAISFEFTTTVNKLLLGGLVGELTGTVDRCNVNVSFNISANYLQVGSIAGNTRKATILNSYATCSGTITSALSSLRSVGALAGYASSSTFKACTVHGRLTVMVNETPLSGEMAWIGELSNMNEIELRNNNLCDAVFE